MKAIKKGEETHSATELHAHPSVHTEGKDKTKWHEAVDAATKGGKTASYALAQYIYNKMTEKCMNVEDILKSEDYKTMGGC